MDGNILKIASEMEVALRYTLLTLLTVDMVFIVDMVYAVGIILHC